MQTSNFDKSWDNPHAIRISRGGYRRKGKGGQKNYRDLWPNKELFDDWSKARKAGMVKEFEPEYRQRYNAQLSLLSPQKVYDDLIVLGGEDAVLLCHCDADEACHRFLVAQWLEENLGIKVPEV